MKYVGLTLAGLIAVFGVAAYAATLPAKTTEPIHVKWLIAHEPVSLFDRAEAQFAKTFNTYGDGTVVIDVAKPADFGSVIGRLSGGEVLDILDRGGAQMATVVVGSLVNKVPEIQIMNLPFLFRDYASAEKVFESPVGDQLLNIIDKDTTAHALAFTYSGGFVVIDSNTKNLTDADDFSGITVGTIDGPMAERTLAAFGATPETLDRTIGSKQTAKRLDEYDAMELPYTRIFPDIAPPKYVFETFHSLFTTAIIASDSFYNSLSKKNKEAFTRAAMEAAKAEREDSIALATQNRAALVASGTVITSLSASSTAILRAKAQSVYDEFEAQYGSDLVHAIQGAQ